MFGVAIDGGSAEGVKRLLLPANHTALSGLSRLRAAYRLRTELGIEAWHWTSHGRWSDPVHRRGYWTGISAAAGDDRIGYGYRLPRRGDTHDEADDEGYSRIDDGDPRTFWKSNPYLDRRYTGIAGEHRDWVTIELPHAAPVNAISIAWGTPFARDYEVQYWIGADEYNGHWQTFTGGRVVESGGGRAFLVLSAHPISTRFVRLLLTRSSHEAAAGSTDPRDALGYAVAEIGLGRFAHGRFDDMIRHAAAQRRQTVIHVSSTDPWHRSVDRDPDTVQPSLAALRGAGIIGTAAPMIPIGVLYDDPDNMIAMLAALKSHGVAMDRIELGEEPDGQLVNAEDYGALYIALARRIRSRFPALQLGGPSLVNGVSDTWLDPDRDASWTSRFFKYLRARHALDLLDFFTFEYFPFDDVCGRASEKLRDQTVLLHDLYARLDKDGVPKRVPWLITEFGYSAYGGAPLVQMPSALAIADIVGDFIGHGGKAAFAYGSTPDGPIAGRRRCAGKGNLTFWLPDRAGRAAWAMPSLAALRLLTRDWVVPGSAPHAMFPSRSSLADGKGHAWVSSYALRRPDRRWSILLVNRAPRSINAVIAVEPARRTGAVTIAQYSWRQYRWVRPTAGGHPVLDVPSDHRRLARWDGRTMLPPLSLSVVTGG